MWCRMDLCRKIGSRLDIYVNALRKSSYQCCNSPKYPDIEHAVWDILEDERKVVLEQPQYRYSTRNGSVIIHFYSKPCVWDTLLHYLSLHHQQWQWLEKIQQGEQQGQINRLQVPLRSS